MSKLLIRLEWYSADDPQTQVLQLSPISDAISITARKGLDIKNNIMDVELKNPNSKYVDTNGLIRFQEEDVLKLYVKNTKEASDVDSTWWGNDNLIGIYYLEEYAHQTSNGGYRIKLTAVDKAYVLFNKVATNSYGVETNDYWTSPGIFRSITRINTSIDSTTDGYIGSDNDSGVRFSLDAKFVSEGGKISDYRSDISTNLNGSLSSGGTTITVDDTSGFKDSGTLVIGTEHIFYTNKTSTTFTGCVRAIDDTTDDSHSDNTIVYQGFPIVDLTKIWKPLYEWLNDLGQTQYTNYDDEDTIGGQLYYNRSFILWIDKDNKIHWIPADDSVDTDLVVGDDELFEVSIERSVFDSVNMVIYNVGEDMYGVGSVWYFFDESSDVSELKMRYQPMTELIDTILNEEYKANPSSFPSASAGDSNRRFPNSYPYTPKFLSDANKWITQIRGESSKTNAANDSEFNTILRYAAYWRGRAESQLITSKLSGLRHRGTITRRGELVNPGDLITITSSKTGLKTQKVRVIDATYTISNGQFSSTLDVEEDEKAIN